MDKQALPGEKIYIPGRLSLIKPGKYESITIPISYNNRFKGDIQCQKLVVEGFLYGSGSIYADSVFVSGTLEISDGTLCSKIIECSGNLLCPNLISENFESYGTVEIEKAKSLNMLIKSNDKSEKISFIKNIKIILKKFIKYFFRIKKTEVKKIKIDELNCSTLYAEGLVSDVIFSKTATLARGSFVKRIVCGSLTLKDGCTAGLVETATESLGEKGFSAAEIFDMYEKGIIDKEEADDMLNNN